MEPIKFNEDNLIVADKYAPEAEVVYTNKPTDSKVKIRISSDAIEKYLDCGARVQIAYDPIQNLLAIRKPLTEKGGRALVINEKNGHGTVDFQHSGLPSFPEKVLLNNFEKTEKAYHYKVLPELQVAVSDS